MYLQFHDSEREDSSEVYGPFEHVTVRFEFLLNETGENVQSLAHQDSDEIWWAPDGKSYDCWVVFPNQPKPNRHLT